MSERPDEPAEMSDSMRDYVAAFAAVERPAAAVSAQTWRAIEEQTEPDRRRVLVVGIGAAVAVAAAVVLAFTSLGGSTLDREDGDASVQAPHAGGVDETGGELSFKGPAKKVDRSGTQTLRPAPLEPNPVVDADLSAVPDVPDAPPQADPIVPEPPARTKPRKQATKGPTTKRTLQDELELFKQAKRALDAGRAAESVSLLDRFAEEFPKGALRLEAKVLRAEALCAAGRTSAATKLRDRFVDSHPSSPLASRMRDVCR